MAVLRAMSEAEVSHPRRLRLPLADLRRAGGDFVWLTLRAPPDWRSLPGQFVNVLCESDLAALAATDGRILEPETGVWPEATGLELRRPWPVVRRPMSVARVRPGSGGPEIILLVRIVGRGTRFLASRPLGTALDLVGPLGNWFTPPEDDRLCVLVGGGCGVAPIFGLADHLAAAGRRCLAIFGAAALADMPVRFRRTPRPTRGHVELTDAVEEFAERGVLAILATDDGSAGFEGTATDALRRWLEDLARGERPALYGCGPEPMLKALARVAEERDLACQISLERWMGCGAGLCLSCVHKRRDAADPKGWSFRLTCREGPVVQARDLVWEEGGA